MGAQRENPPSMRDSERDSAGIVPFQGTTSLRFKLCMFPILERQSKRYLEKPKRESERVVEAQPHDCVGTSPM